MIYYILLKAGAFDGLVDRESEIYLTGSQETHLRGIYTAAVHLSHSSLWPSNLHIGLLLRPGYIHLMMLPRALYQSLNLERLALETGRWELKC